MSGLTRSLNAEGIQTRPHFCYPFERTAGGGVEVAEQDTEEHVMSCETVIASCPQGFRVSRPEFGIPWPEYRTRVDAGEIASALRMHEDRPTVTGSTRGSGTDDPDVQIDVEAG